MSALDYSTFAKTMGLISEMVGKRMSDGLIEMYYTALSDMPTNDFTAAATRIVRERKFTSLPTPADFLDGTLSRTEDRALLAAEEVLSMMRGQGGDTDVQFQDPAIMAAVELAGGWPFLCDYVNSFDLDKLGIWKREFAALYKAGAARKSTAPRVLLGRHSRDNIVRGYLNPETGELKNALGNVVRLLPWGMKQIAAAPEAEPVDDEEGLQRIRQLTDIIGTNDEVRT